MVLAVEKLRVVCGFFVDQSSPRGYRQSLGGCGAWDRAEWEGDWDQVAKS